MVATTVSPAPVTSYTSCATVGIWTSPALKEERHPLGTPGYQHCCVLSFGEQEIRSTAKTLIVFYCDAGSGLGLFAVRRDDGGSPVFEVIIPLRVNNDRNAPLLRGNQ